MNPFLVIILYEKAFIDSIWIKNVSQNNLPHFGIVIRNNIYDFT